MNFNNKDIALNEKILDKLNERMFKFYAKHGQMPLGFVLGPVEYLSVVATVKDITEAKELIDINVKETKLFGIPVYIKPNAGVELIIPPKLVPYFAMGVIK